MVTVLLVSFTNSTHTHAGAFSSRTAQDDNMSRRELVDSPQDPVVRRAYVFSPTAEMRERFRLAQAEDDFEYYDEPVVIFTEELQYDRDVDGWRPVIRRRCVDAFCAYLLNEVPRLQKKARRSSGGRSAPCNVTANEVSNFAKQPRPCRSCIRIR